MDSRDDVGALDNRGAAAVVSLAAPFVEHTTCSRRSLMLYWLARLFLKQLYRIWPLTDYGMRALRVIETGFTRLPHPKAVQHESGEFGGVAVETCLPHRPATDAMVNATVLFLHGGAFLFCGPATHRHVCSRLAETLAIPVHSVRYRQLPEVGVGTSVHDAYTAYLGLADRAAAPDKIVLVGDSAGGFLAAKVCELAAADGIPGPAAFVGYSPQLSLDADERDPALLNSDAYMPVSAVRRAKTKWGRGPVELRGLRCLADAPARIYPPTFMTAAHHELLEPDIHTLTRSLHHAGQTVETHTWHRQVHAFPVLAGLLPESRQAIGLTAQFLRRTLR